MGRGLHRSERLGDPKAPDDADPATVDALDAEQLYQLLEQEVVPMWYDRDEHGVPRQWVRVMKEAIRTAGQQFTARRMVQDYVTRYYAPMLRGDVLSDDPPIG